MEKILPSTWLSVGRVNWLNIIFFNLKFISLKVCLSVSFDLFVTLLVTVGTLHCLLSICIVVNQKLQQTVLWGEGVVSLQYRCVTAAKTDIKDILHQRVMIHVTFLSSYD